MGVCRVVCLCMGNELPSAQVFKRLQESHMGRRGWGASPLMPAGLTVAFHTHPKCLLAFLPSCLPAQLQLPSVHLTSHCESPRATLL